MLVKDVMTTPVQTTGPDGSLQEAAKRMKALDVGPLPVCENDTLVGMITDRDITVRAVAEGYGAFMGKIRDVMTPNVVHCFEDQDVCEAARLMKEKQLRRLVVLNRDKRLVGIVSLADLAVAAGDEKLAGETLQRVSQPASPNSHALPKTQSRLDPVHATPVDPEVQALQAIDNGQPTGEHRLQDVLPEVKEVAQKAGGFKHLAEIAKTLDEPKG